MVPDIEAETAESAAKIAIDAYNPRTPFCSGASGEQNVEFVNYAERVHGFTSVGTYNGSGKGSRPIVIEIRKP